MSMTHAIHTILAALLFLLLASGCADRGDEGTPLTQRDAAATSAVQADDGSLRVNIIANDLMQWDVKEFTVQPGQEVTVELTSEGRRPKRVMAHNFVLLRPEVEMAAFIQTASLAIDEDYVPQQYAEQVLVASDLAGPGETVTVTFNAPDAPGAYPYVCSFPGHYYGGMNGVMTVQAD